MLIKIFSFILLTGYCTNGALLLWSKYKFHISPLKNFNDESFNELIRNLGYPEVNIYKSSELLPEFKEILDGYHTVYTPNGEINTENATEIFGEDDLALIKTKQVLDTAQSNVLSVMILPGSRSKREASISTTTEEALPYNIPKGPVLYKGLSTKDNTYGLLYSSQPLLLKSNYSDLFLGETRSDLITIDTAGRDKSIKLSVKIPTEDNIVTLRFTYTWSNYYWSLISVKITDNKNIYSLNLNIEQDVTAPAHFSYHCTGDNVFSDVNTTAKLYIYDMQTQIDSADGRFSDAYDCVDFTTAPIWSGLFVTAILGIVLIIALIAISDIKTMDKFDNHKTKQLAITVAE